MAKLLNFITVFIIAAVFSGCLITFIYNLEVANDAKTNILNDPNGNLAAFNNSLGSNYQTFEVKTNEQKNSSLSESAYTPIGAYVSFSILGSLSRFFSVIVAFVESFFKVMSEFIGVPSFVLGIITSLIILGVIFAAYYTGKTGD